MEIAEIETFKLALSVSCLKMAMVLWTVAREMEIFDNLAVHFFFGIINDSNIR